MFTKQDMQQANIKGRINDPSYILISANVKRHISRIRELLAITDRRVGADNILIRLLGSVNGVTRSMSYEEVRWYCRRNLARIAAGTGCIGPSSFGDSHVGNFISKQDELISLVAEDINPNVPWQEISPARFIYHTHTNLDWEIGSEEVGRGVSLMEINLVALVWQWYTSLNDDSAHPDRQRANTPVWLYRYVVYNTLPSYFNLAIFNRHYYSATDEAYKVRDRNPIYPVPDIGDFMERHIRNTAVNLRSGDKTPMQILNHIPLPFPDKNREGDSAMGLVTDIASKRMVWQQEIIYEIANLYFLSFVMRYRNPAVEGFIPTKRREVLMWCNTRPLGRMDVPVARRVKLDIIDPVMGQLSK